MLSCSSVFFFFSSRRRHTRWTGDWSSDVCSSDLISKFESERANAEAQVRYDSISKQGYESLYDFPKPTIAKITRSEERRVGKSVDLGGRSSTKKKKRKTQEVKI